MTSDPSCCLPGDSVAVAAQIMRREDIGPVLVVSGYEQRRLLGIVTDRDIVVKVVAERRDPHSTRLDGIMSPNPVSCRETDSVASAMRAMGDHQVRRIPVVDGQGCLVGIIAQADVARAADEEPVGEMLEEISQPYGRNDWPENRQGGRSIAFAIAIGAACLGIGAALAYRRSSVPKSDRKLEQRVRAKLGRRHKHVVVRADAGHVALSGPIAANDVPDLIARVRTISGVHSIENLLEVHAGQSNSVSGGLLQYGARAR